MIGDPEVPVEHTRVRGPAVLNLADAAVRRVVSATSLPGRRADARFYLQTVGLFVVFTLALYRVFPKFLMQNVDGVNLYFVLDKLNIWRSSAWETTTVTPLESMTSTLWFPLNPTFIPPFSSFAISSDPTLRVYLLAVFASTVIFVSSLFFYIAIGIVRPFAVAAAWISFALIMLQDTNLFQGINNVQVMAWAYVCLGLLTYVGKHTTWKGGLVLLFFQLAVLAYVLGDPVWHVTTLPVFGLVALAILLGAESAIERWLKVASLALALGVQLALQTYVFLFYTVADTARSVLPREYADVGRSASSAGHLFRTDTAAFVIGLLLIVGLAIGRVEDLSVRPRLTNLVIKAAIAFYLIVSAAGYVYLHFPQSPAFRTGYFMEMAYPLAALFIAGALRRLYRVAHTTLGGSGSVIQLVGGWRSIGLAGLGVGAYVAWHLHAFPEAAPAPLANAILTIASVLLLLYFGWERPAIAVGSVLVLVILQAHIDASYGGRGGDTQFDGTKRMGLDGNALVDRMVAETAIRPGDTFRGYVEDLYQRTLTSPSVGDELVGHWLNNWDQFDSGQTLFSWSIFNVPTISEYDPFVRPLYYAFFTRLLNLPTDTQLDNYLGATRPNNAVMALMGVRFIVTDRSNLGAPEIMPFGNGRFHVLELPNPNLASYSPTRVLHVSTAREALDQLQSATFDPQADVLVQQPADDLPELVAAPPAELRFQRSGYSVTASSPDWSLLVLPVQYSHCYVVDGGSTRDARLLRVNLVQTGLLVHGDVRVNVDFRHWPFASPECQRQDYADAIGLRVADLQPPPG